MMIFFVDVTNIISLLILIKTPFFFRKYITKMIKLHQFLKNQDQLRLKN